ncbi:Peroxisome proliferator-activated receptor gamma coactivator 1-alpha [Harpegnathos saltator]|uniref:Peroxisome proliferator-activated receptor gamma coactivator 1-alpha n=1 Tax=Harpegnathos saltator TaxID=610380 RepID=E2C2G9_HARSA|nr:Peroxisome proliferator-activated receptor gamma coactivator 1-alpha [Harpegnathos saltator]
MTLKVMAKVKLKVTIKSVIRFSTTFVFKVFHENLILQSYPRIPVFLRHPVYGGCFRAVQKYIMSFNNGLSSNRPSVTFLSDLEMEPITALTEDTPLFDEDAKVEDFLAHSGAVQKNMSFNDGLSSVNSPSVTFLSNSEMEPITDITEDTPLFDEDAKIDDSIEISRPELIDFEKLLMEAQRKYPDENIPDYCQNIFKSPPSPKKSAHSEMFESEIMSMFLQCNEFDHLKLDEWHEMIEKTQNFTRDKAKCLKSSEVVERETILHKYEGEETMGLRLEDIFPELGTIYTNDLQDISIMPIRPQEEMEKIVVQVKKNLEVEEKKMNPIDQPTTSHKACKSFKKSVGTKKISAGRRKKVVEKNLTSTKLEGQKQSVDVDTMANRTIGEDIKSIEAVDLSSLLEQFENIVQSQNLPKSHDKSTVKNTLPQHAQPAKRPRGRPPKQRNCQETMHKESTVPIMDQHKVIQDPSQKKPTDMAKVQETRRTTSTATTIPNTKQSESHSQNTNSQIKDVQHVPRPSHSDSLTVEGSSSINLEHNYCMVSTGKNPVSNDTPKTHQNNIQSAAAVISCDKQRRESDVMSTKITEMKQIPTTSASWNNQTQDNTNLINTSKNSTSSTPTRYEMKIQSVLARNILKSRQKGNVVNANVRLSPMVSVLKKPNTQNLIPSSNIKENIIVNTDDIKNTVQQSTDLDKPKKKLNLEEYRKKRERIDSKSGNSSIKRKLVYLYNACTTTEPFFDKGEMIWSKNEIEEAVKSISDFTETKSTTCDVAVQTYETIFEFAGCSTAEKKEETETTNKSRSPPHYYRKHYNDRSRREWQQQVEERKVVYVGGIENGTTKADLRQRFRSFGTIKEISLHFRTQAISFGFVTFEDKNDAYRAVEHGNDGQSPKYHLSFGGRRAFCQVNYADLDGAANSSHGSCPNSPTDQSSFDDLLQEAMSLRKLV